MPLYLFYTIVQKSQKWPKTQIKGGSCLNVFVLALLLWFFLFLSSPSLLPSKHPCPAGIIVFTLLLYATQWWNSLTSYKMFLAKAIFREEWSPRYWLPSLNSCSCNPKSPESELTPTPAIHSHQPSTNHSHYQPFSFPIRSPANLTQTTDLSWPTNWRWCCTSKRLDVLTNYSTGPFLSIWPHLLCRVNRGLCVPRLLEIVSCRLPHLNWITSEKSLSVSNFSEDRFCEKHFVRS